MSALKWPQVFPPGPAPKVPTSSRSSAVPVHIHTCELSPLTLPKAFEGAGETTWGTDIPHIHHPTSSSTSILCQVERVPLPLLGQVHPAAKASTAVAAKQGSLDRREKVSEMLTASAGRDPHQPGHLAAIVNLARSTDVLLDYSVLLGAQAAKDTHIHLCLSSRFLL